MSNKSVSNKDRDASLPLLAHGPHEVFAVSVGGTLLLTQPQHVLLVAANAAERLCSFFVGS